MRARKDKPAINFVETGRATACSKLERKGYLLARIGSVVIAHEAVASKTTITSFDYPFSCWCKLLRGGDGQDVNDIKSCLATLTVKVKHK